MFCRHCVFEISEQARFCPRCGKAVAPASGAAASHGEEALGRATPAGGAPPTSVPQTPPAQATTSQPAPTPAPASAPTAPEPAPTPQGKKRRRGVAVALVAAAFVLVTAGICAVFLSRAGFGQTMSVGAHLLDEAVPVSRWAHIVPVDDAGTPLAGQFVRFVGAENEAGEQIELAQGQTFEIEGAEGISLDEALRDMPDGTYRAVVEDAEGRVRPLPPLALGGIGSYMGTVAFEIDREHTIGADRLILAKIEALRAEYGVPEFKTARVDGKYLGYVSGTPTPSLFYCPGGDRNGFVASYQLKGEEGFDGEYPVFNREIWVYDQEEDELYSVLPPEGTSFVRSARETRVTREVCFPDDWKYTDGSVFGFTVSTEDDTRVDAYYRFDSDGKMKLVATASVEFDASGKQVAWYVDGSPVSAERALSVWEEFHGTEDDFYGNLIYQACRYGDEGSAKQGDYSCFDGSDSSLTNYTVLSPTNNFYHEGVRAQLNRSIQGIGEYETNWETVAVPSVPPGSDPAEPTIDQDWSYVELDVGKNDEEAIAKINAALKDGYDRVKSVTLQPIEDDADVCLCRQSVMTYRTEDIIGIRSESIYANFDYSAERSQVKGEVYDTTTGEQIEVWDALGLSKDELDAQAVDAIVAYAKMKPAQKSPYKSDEELTEAVRTFVEEGRGSYLLCDAGVTYFLPEESLGYSASEGSKEIMVLPAESKSLTGVDFRPYYKLLSPGILKQGE